MLWTFFVVKSKKGGKGLNSIFKYTENNGEVIGKYIGTLMDYNEDASNNPSDYKWMPRQWSKRN